MVCLLSTAIAPNNRPRWTRLRGAGSRRSGTQSDRQRHRCLHIFVYWKHERQLAKWGVLGIFHPGFATTWGLHANNSRRFKTGCWLHLFLSYRILQCRRQVRHALFVALFFRWDVGYCDCRSSLRLLPVRCRIFSVKYLHASHYYLLSNFDHSRTEQ